MQEKQFHRWNFGHSVQALQAGQFFKFKDDRDIHRINALRAQKKDYFEVNVKDFIKVVPSY